MTTWGLDPSDRKSQRSARMAAAVNRAARSRRSSFDLPSSITMVRLSAPVASRRLTLRPLAPRRPPRIPAPRSGARAPRSRPRRPRRSRGRVLLGGDALRPDAAPSDGDGALHCVDRDERLRTELSRLGHRKRIGRRPGGPAASMATAPHSLRARRRGRRPVIGPRIPGSWRQRAAL
jgi:hypothetical protein